VELLTSELKKAGNWIVERFGNTPHRDKNQSLSFFDNKNSKEDLRKLIDNYDPKTEGILILITQPDNATWFITFKLKSKSEDSKK